MIWVNIAVPVIKMDIWMYRQSILYIVPIGLSMVITVCSLVPLIYRTCSNVEHVCDLD
jgi:hypothetical protein